MSDSRYSVAGQVDLARPGRRLCTAELAVSPVVSAVLATAPWLPILFGAGLDLNLSPLCSSGETGQLRDVFLSGEREPSWRGCRVAPERYCARLP